MSGRALRSLVALVLLLPGCALLGVPEQRQTLQRFARIRGEVRIDRPSPHPIVVVLLRRAENADEIAPAPASAPGSVVETVADHFPLAGPGAFAFGVAPGTYRLAAFIDENRDGNYDPKRIPVLFVHGMNGYPQQFSTLIAALDRTRFQPWFYFYPSGVHLDGVAEHLTDTISKLRLEHGFEALAVVAHSMGGLVSRSFIQRYEAQGPRHQIELFVSISTPWGGSESATGIENAPERLMVFSWLDMRPGSDFLEQLFYEPGAPLRARPLPPQTHFHMIIGFRRPGRSSGPSSDGVVSVRSQARPEAVDAARSILPLDFDHIEILRSEAVAKRLGTLLSRRFHERLQGLASP